MVRSRGWPAQHGGGGESSAWRPRAPERGALHSSFSLFGTGRGGLGAAPGAAPVLSMAAISAVRPDRPPVWHAAPRLQDAERGISLSGLICPDLLLPCPVPTGG
jgi:hypothetical protein